MMNAKIFSVLMTHAITKSTEQGLKKTDFKKMISLQKIKNAVAPAQDEKKSFYEAIEEMLKFEIIREFEQEAGNQVIKYYCTTIKGRKEFETNTYRPFGEVVQEVAVTKEEVHNDAFASQTEVNGDPVQPHVVLELTAKDKAVMKVLEMIANATDVEQMLKLNAMLEVVQKM